ncbi:MAG: hypothetical protein V3W18_14125 [candidate division Zixibacteria bacterium]
MIRRIFISIAIAGTIILACSNPFAPPELGPGMLAPILPQNCSECPDSVNAYSVLSNFKYAYENRDIDVYENLLDNDFLFIYIDQDQHGEIEQIEVPRNGTSGDLNSTGRMFEVFNEIRLDTWIPRRLEQEGPLTPAHPDETWEVWIVTFHLFLKDLTGDYNFQQFEANGLAFFKIRKSADGYWRIIVWEDHSFS